MKKINDYEQLKALVSAQLKAGIMTNASVCARDYMPYMEAGTLEFEEGPFGLLVVRRKREHNYVSFWLTPGADVRALPLPERCLLEVAWRERDEALKKLAADFEAAGFERPLGRIRYIRPAGLQAPEIIPLEDGMTERVVCGRLCAGAAESCEIMSAEDAEEVRAFIAENFAERTGCWPLAGELEYDKVIELRDEKGLCAMIHCQTDGQMPNIRHMAVRGDCRGRRLTAKLLSRFCAGLDGRAMVWVKEHDEPAKHAYSKFGFAPDGRESSVFFRV